MVCLDTDILVGLLRCNKDAIASLEALEKQGEQMKTTIINVCELFEGANLFYKKEAAINSTEQLLTKLSIVGLSHQTTKIFGVIACELNRQGKKIEDFDLLIASIVLENNETLVTRNVKHFKRIQGLKIKQW